MRSFNPMTARQVDLVDQQAGSNAGFGGSGGS
jgi:hypothetical protein